MVPDVLGVMAGGTGQGAAHRRHQLRLSCHHHPRRRRHAGRHVTCDPPRGCHQLQDVHGVSEFGHGRRRSDLSRHEHGGAAWRDDLVQSKAPLVLKDDALCSIEVTKKTLETWRQDVANIEAAITSFQSAKDHAENVLDCALADLDEAYENSTGFQGYVPSEDISVCGALEDMGASDLDRTFRRSLQEMYKFHALGRQVA